MGRRAKDLDPSLSLVALFGAEMRDRRTEADLSQERLGAECGYSAQQIGQVELGHRRPSPQLAEACDRIFAVKLFTRLLRHIHNEAFPSWFQLYAELEATATHIRVYWAELLTGLLQTEDYARSVFEQPEQQ